MNWNIIIGPGCLLAGIFISLYVKDRARETAETEFDKCIKSALAVFKLELMQSFDGIYTRSGENRLLLEAQADRIDIHELRISKLESRMDDNKHHNRLPT